MSQSIVSYFSSPIHFPCALRSVTVVIILRIYAMWNQSKTILGLLLCVFVPETIIAFVFAGVNDNPNTYMSGMSEILLT